MSYLKWICLIFFLVILLLSHANAKDNTVGHVANEYGYKGTGSNNSSSASETKPDELKTTKRDKSYYEFVSVGDWGCTKETDKTVNNILERKPNLVIGLGDYSYEDSVGCWIDKIRPIEGIFKIVLGNHENAQNYPLSVLESLRFSTPDIYMSLFGLKEQYYSFEYGNVHFLIMSTEIPFEKGSAQYEFTHNDLARALDDSNAKWIIVANHRTIYPPYYGPTGALDSSIGKKFRETYHPLFDLFGVDMVLQGHVHYYQRTFPIKYNMSNSDTPTVIDNHTNHYNNPSAPIFITVGTGGVEIGHPGVLSKPYYEASSESSVFGILSIELNKNGSELIGTFYNNGIIDGPYAQDIFTISKQPNS